MDTERLRELLGARDKIDADIKEVVNGTKERKTIKCGNCGEEGHTARTCEQRKSARVLT